MTRKEAIEQLKFMLEQKPKEPPLECDYIEEWFDTDREIRNTFDMAIKSLEAWDKVIEEIKEQFDGCDICEWFEDYDWDENNISEYRYIGSVDDILDIIRKHLGELFYIQRNMGRN
jgi:hypothetical protein